MLQSFQRAVALFSIVIASAFLVGCGPGAPVSGSSDPATEAADGALAPEGGANVTAKSEPDADTPEKASEPAPEDSKAADSKESEK